MMGLYNRIEFEKEIIAAVYKYTHEHVDIIIEDGEVYGTYHIAVIQN